MTSAEKDYVYFQHDASIYLGVPQTELFELRAYGKGPVYRTVHGAVQYLKEDLDVWKTENQVELLPYRRTIMNHYTTLKELRNHGACHGRYAYLTAILDGMSIAEAETEENEYESSDEYRECGIDDLYKIPLVDILKHNDLDDALWALVANLHPESDKFARLFACDCAEHTLHIFEDKFPDDKRPRNAIEVARKSANGEATQDELDVAGDAAWDAAWAAARAAWDAAGDAAWAAARAAGDAAGEAAVDAAGDAARAAAWAAGAAERKEQADTFIELFGGY